mmetsp:Transcript_73021/g.211382  ORF Transcript_73021/g.211382 Transcript_73021/m.211382 type:complete len:294 (+) Transcript_73021:410-1291(+)
MASSLPVIGAFMVCSKSPSRFLSSTSNLEMESVTFFACAFKVAKTAEMAWSLANRIVSMAFAGFGSAAARFVPGVTEATDFAAASTLATMSSCVASSCRCFCCASAWRFSATKRSKRRFFSASSFSKVASFNSFSVFASIAFFSASRCSSCCNLPPAPMALAHSFSKPVRSLIAEATLAFRAAWSLNLPDSICSTTASMSATTFCAFANNIGGAPGLSRALCNANSTEANSHCDCKPCILSMAPLTLACRSVLLSFGFFSTSASMPSTSATVLSVNFFCSALIGICSSFSSAW